ncbi:MAG: YhbY family RNA-binding protein [Clostridia bacterium]|nr:YhbY family RNA-binding protein [Clostridia bacterium]
MITSKQRSALMKLANSLETIVHIGKNGLTDAVLAQINEILELKELIKIGVQKNAEFTSKMIIDEVAAKLKAEPIHSIGSKIILYRRSSKKDIEHLVF